MRPPHIDTPPMHVIFDAARHFGLTDREVWETVDQSLAGAGEDGTVAESLDELTAALARRILAKERRILAEKRRAAFDEL